MDQASSAPRWFRPWRPAQSRAEIEHDAADLGTCFGLDMSLDEPVAAPAAGAPARAPWWAPWSAGARRADAAGD
jgi:hypothetical protein